MPRLGKQRTETYQRTKNDKPRVVLRRTLDKYREAYFQKGKTDAKNELFSLVISILLDAVGTHQDREFKQMFVAALTTWFKNANIIDEWYELKNKGVHYGQHPEKVAVPTFDPKCCSGRSLGDRRAAQSLSCLPTSSCRSSTH